jgi:hypothetical protein
MPSVDFLMWSWASPSKRLATVLYSCRGMLQHECYGIRVQNLQPARDLLLQQRGRTRSKWRV